MVGFGSSLRLARRTGWEGAYLDYETLKLLLSQIEAVYEEEGHRARQQQQQQQQQQQPNNGRNHDSVDGTTNSVGEERPSARSYRSKRQPSKKQKQQHHQTCDYRDELFLEDDSDAAFVSTDEGDDDDENNNIDNTDDDEFDDNYDDYSFDENDTYDETYPMISPDHFDQRWRMKNGPPSTTASTSMMMMPSPQPQSRDNSFPRSTQFTKSYSYEESAATTTGGGASVQSTSTICIPVTTCCWNALAFCNRSSSPQSTTAYRKRKISRRRWSSQTYDDNDIVQFYRSSNHPRKGRWNHPNGNNNNNNNNMNHNDTNNTFFLAETSTNGNDNDGVTISYNNTSQYSAISSTQRDNNNSTYTNTGTFPLGPTLLNAPTVQSSYANEGTLLFNSPDAVGYHSNNFITANESQNRNQSTHPTFYDNNLQTMSHFNNNNRDPYTPVMERQTITFPTTSMHSNNNNDFSPPRYSTNNIVTNGKTYNNGRPPTKKKSVRQRQAERRMRQRIRERREQRVPRHIRVAHSKARAITERFLGLLRAEVEKVLLFAQSRLGELADTAGSLRFPALEEGYSSHYAYSHRSTNNYYNQQYPNRSPDQGRNTPHHHNNHRRSATNDLYRFADNGIHPSASSSSDEGGNAGGLFSWSDDISSGGGDERDTIRMAPSQRGPSPVISRPSPYSEDMTSGSYQSDPVVDRNDSTATHNKNDPIDAVRRQLLHFAELRKNRSIFQRNDHILGEDMLFLSAVEEADGYTAVGVELLHILKYISINLIAVRKICRKHDRLLMNRMVGGYYHRIQNSGDGAPTETSYGRDQDAQTLGGLIAKVSGDIHDAHPALIGQMNHYKLEGVYDSKIQKLANSRTIEVVSSCLALALSEYEVARSRANALTNLNTKADKSITKLLSPTTYEFQNIKIVQQRKPTTENDENISTASSISITRLQYTVVSIFALREAARFKTDYYMTYLARSMLTFSGQQIIGDGLDGCSRATLEFIVSYNPDAALLCNTSTLMEGLRRGQWSKFPMDEIMISALAIGASSSSSSQYQVLNAATTSLLSRDENKVANAVSVVPESKSVMLKRLIRGQFPRRLTGRRILAADEVPKIALNINRMSCFLYMMNYFISHSTAVQNVQASGFSDGYSAVIIGVPNVSAIMITLLHCWLETRETEILPYKYKVRTFRRLFIFSALVAVIGNVIHAFAIRKKSVPYAILGRFLIGFSSAELLHRQLMAACMPSHFVTESARLMLFRVTGATCGLLLGSVIQVIPNLMSRIGSQSHQVSSWCMSFFWAVHLLRVAIHFRSNVQRIETSNQINGDDDDRKEIERADDDDSDSSTSVMATPSTVLLRKVLEGHSSNDSLRHSEKDRDHLTIAKPPTPASETDLTESSRRLGSEARNKKRRRVRAPISQARLFSKIRTFLSLHVGIPIALIIFVFVTVAIETSFTAAPLITNRYFGWGGAKASTFLGWLTILILPIHFGCEIVARLYQERIVVKRSLIVIAGIILFMLNWTSLYSLVCEFYLLVSRNKSNGICHTMVVGTNNSIYDGKVGVVQYSLGLIMLYSALIALEGATLSLLSKISPLGSTRSVSMNVGTLVTLLGLTSRIFADLNILVIDVSDRMINVDIVNSLMIPLFICAVVLFYVVKKYFFFLM